MNPCFLFKSRRTCSYLVAFIHIFVWSACLGSSAGFDGSVGPLRRFLCVFVLVWAPQEKHLLSVWVLAQSRTFRWTYLLSYASAKRWVDFGWRPGCAKRHLAQICQRTRGSVCACVCGGLYSSCMVEVYWVWRECCVTGVYERHHLNLKPDLLMQCILMHP